MLAFVRIDNRLIHGQVIEAWVPTLKVDHLVVADDEAASNPLTRMAMALAVPSNVRTEIAALGQVDVGAILQAPGRTLVLLRDVRDAVTAFERGLRFSALNVGNVHAAPERVQISPAVFLSRSEIGALQSLEQRGVRVELRTLPRDKPLPLTDIAARAGA